MGTMSNRNNLTGRLAGLLVALAAVVAFQPGCAGTQDISEIRKATEQEAVKWWRKAAEQGHAEAQYLLGEAYGASLVRRFISAHTYFRRRF